MFLNCSTEKSGPKNRFPVTYEDEDVAEDTKLGVSDSYTSSGNLNLTS